LTEQIEKDCQAARKLHLERRRTKHEIR
jgi:hypothetical protein